jgi:hypothetical protein
VKDPVEGTNPLWSCTLYPISGIGLVRLMPGGAAVPGSNPGGFALNIGAAAVTAAPAN